MVPQNILKKNRITEDDALELFKETNLVELGKKATEIKKSFHPDNIATFVVDRNINYTNICTSKCRFCAFYREIDHPEAYLLSQKEIDRKISEAVELGATQIMLQGGLHPDLKIDFYQDMLESIKSKFKVHIHSFSPPEIVHISEISKIDIKDTISKLKESGLDSIPGGGAEILVDQVRQIISPKKIKTNIWLKVMETAHNLGMKTTATMMFGSVEKAKDRVIHLKKIRDLQDKTGGFRAFIPWTFQPGKTEIGGEQTTGADYIKTLAISRIYLDNIENIQASWVTQGDKMAQISIFFGANDLGSTMIEENVVRATGLNYRLPQESLISLIKDIDYVPAKRNTKYEILKTY